MADIMTEKKEQKIYVEYDVDDKGITLSDIKLNGCTHEHSLQTNNLTNDEKQIFTNGNIDAITNNENVVKTIKEKLNEVTGGGKRKRKTQLKKRGGKRKSIKKNKSRKH